MRILKNVRSSLFIVIPLFVISKTAVAQYKLGLPMKNTSFFSSYACSNNEEYLAASSGEETYVWDLRSGRLLYTLAGAMGWPDDGTSGGRNPVRAFNSDGSKLVTIKNDKAVVWTLKDGKPLFEIASYNYTYGQSAPIKSAVFNKNGDEIVTTKWGSEIDVWSAKDGDLLYSFDVNPDDEREDEYGFGITIDYAEFKDSIIAVLESDKTLDLIFPRSFEKLETVTLEEGILDYGFGNDYYFCRESNSVSIFKYGSVKPVKDIGLTPKSSLAIANNTLIYTDGLKQYSVLNLETNQMKVNAIETGKINRICVAKSTDQVLLLKDSGYLLLSSANDYTSEEFKLESKLHLPILSPSGKLLISINERNSISDKEIIEIYNVETGSLINHVRAMIEPVTFASYFNSEKELLISVNNKLQIMDLKDFKPIESTPVEMHWLNGFSPVGNLGESKILANLSSIKRLSKQGVLTPYIEYEKLNRNEHNAIGTVSSADVLLQPKEGKAIVADRSSIFIIDSSQILNEISLSSISDNTQEEIYGLAIDESNKNLFVSSDDKIIVYNLQSQKHFSIDVSDFTMSGCAVMFPIRDSDYILLGTSNEYTCILFLLDIKTKEVIWSEVKERYEMSLLSAISPDHNTVLSQSNHNINLYDVRTGKLTNILKGHTSLVSSAVYNKEGSTILSTSEDGTIIVWDPNTGKILLRQVYLDDNFNEIVTLNQDNYYRASKIAASSLFFKDGLKTIAFDQLDLIKNRPDKVLETIDSIYGLSNKNEIEALRLAWKKRHKNTKNISDFERIEQPIVTITNRTELPYIQTNREVDLAISCFSANGLEQFNIYVNDVPMYNVGGITINGVKQAWDTTIKLELGVGLNQIEIAVSDKKGIKNFRDPLFISYSQRDKSKPKLHFIGIGIDQFADDSKNLNYSVKDIQDFSAFLVSELGEDVTIDTFFNFNVTPQVLQNLATKVSTYGIDDKLIISYSGHGLLSKDFNYYLSAYNVDFKNPEVGGVPYADLEALIQATPDRKRLVLIDACHSGEVDKESLKAESRKKLDARVKGVELEYDYEPVLGIRSSFELMQQNFANLNSTLGATIIAASGGSQFALEDADLGNGVFTFSVLQTLKKNKKCSVKELKKNVFQNVYELTNGRQEPISRSETLGFDWLILE